MNKGLVLRAIRETWATTLVIGLALSLIAGVLNFALPRFQQQFMGGAVRPPAFIERVRSAVLGTETAGMGPMEIATSIAWSHPVVLALLWAHAIIVCTRVPAGEIERGTIDVLLGLPVTRRQLYLSESIVWLVSLVLLLCAAWTGSLIGGSFVSASLRPPPGRVGILLLNLLAMIASVGALASLASTLSDRRGRAVLTVLIFVVGSFLLNYLTLVWPETKNLARLSLLNYYRPVFTLQSGEWPWKDLAILLAGAAALWVAGGVVMERRDLCTT